MASELPAIRSKRAEGSKFLHLLSYRLAIRIAFQVCTIYLKKFSKSQLVLLGIDYYNEYKCNLIISNRMQSFLREISKQTNKISRILNKISEKYPQTASEIELALFAAIKIERTVSKFNESHNQSQSGPIEELAKKNLANRHNNDPILDAAFKNIQSFKQSTSKLQGKINIMINETQAKERKVMHKREHQRSKEIQEPNYTKKQRGKQAKLIDDSFKQVELEDASQSMTDLDKSIQRISAQLIQKLDIKGKLSVEHKHFNEDQ